MKFTVLEIVHGVFDSVDDKVELTNLITEQDYRNVDAVVTDDNLWLGKASRYWSNLTGLLPRSKDEEKKPSFDEFKRKYENGLVRKWEDEIWGLDSFPLRCLKWLIL